MFFRTWENAMALSMAIRGVVALNNPNENFVLADCGIGDVPGHPDWSTSRQVMYYKGAVWTDEAMSATNRPDMVKEVPWDGSYPWRPATISVPMPNGDKFVIQVTKPNTADGSTIAGGMTTTYDPYLTPCYPWHKKFVHQLPNGQWCSSAFVCNHQSGPLSQSKITVTVSTNKDSATLDGHVSVDDVFNKISFQGTTLQACEESTISIPGTGCTLTAACHGGVAGLTAAMLKSLKDLARSGDAGIFTQTTVTDQRWNPCKSGRDTCIGGWDRYERAVTKVAQSLSVYVADQNGNDKGQLNYKISCSAAKSCEGCNTAKFASAVLGLFPGVGSMLGGVAKVAVVGVCSASGC